MRRFKMYYNAIKEVNYILKKEKCLEKANRAYEKCRMRRYNRLFLRGIEYEKEIIKLRAAMY